MLLKRYLGRQKTFQFKSRRCRYFADGYNLGTPALKPYKRAIKTYLNDTILQEKAM